MYPVQSFTVSRPVRTSSFVRAILVYPLRSMDFLASGRSTQPHLLGRPVVVPNSPPFSRRCSPVSFFCSVGRGPSPTRVIYALMTPMTLSTFVGPTPSPEHAEPATVLEDVTNF